MGRTSDSFYDGSDLQMISNSILFDRDGLGAFDALGKVCRMPTGVYTLQKKENNFSNKILG